MIQARSVTAADNGKILVLHVTSRFSFYLDGKTHPLGDLESSVQATSLLGYISNGSILGPQCYPIMYEAVQQGKALVQVKDFKLTIIVDDTLPQSTFPLH